MTAERAPKGGTTGLNGESYEGGQFLPSSARTVKGEQKSQSRKATRKQEISPYVWEVAPEGMASIYSRCEVVTKWAEWQKVLEVADLADAAFAYAGLSREQATELAERWNRGERWMPRS